MSRRLVGFNPETGLLEMDPSLGMRIASALLSRQAGLSDLNGGGSLAAGVGAACREIGEICAYLAKSPSIPADGNSERRFGKIEKWETPTEAASRSRCIGDSRITQLCRAGTLKARKAGRQWLVEQESLNDYINTKSRKGARGKA